MPLLAKLLLALLLLLLERQQRPSAELWVGVRVKHCYGA